ncbi:hypothetical protein ACJX0J_012954 [Zea mays]
MYVEIERGILYIVILCMNLIIAYRGGVIIVATPTSSTNNIDNNREINSIQPFQCGYTCAIQLIVWAAMFSILCFTMFDFVMLCVAICCCCVDTRNMFWIFYKLVMLLELAIPCFYFTNNFNNVTIKSLIIMFILRGVPTHYLLYSGRDSNIGNDISIYMVVIEFIFTLNLLFDVPWKLTYSMFAIYYYCIDIYNTPYIMGLEEKVLHHRESPNAPKNISHNT